MRTLGRVSRTAIATSWLPRFGPLIAIVTAALSGVLIALALTVSAPVSGITQASTAIRVGLPIARAAIDLAAVAAVGFALLPLLAGERTPASARPVFARARTVRHRLGAGVGGGGAGQSRAADGGLVPT